MAQLNYLDKDGVLYLWQKIKNAFALAGHKHAAGDITSGSVTVARGGTGKSSLTSGSYLVGAGTSAVTLKTPAQVLADIGAATQTDIDNSIAAAQTGAALFKGELSAQTTLSNADYKSGWYWIVSTAGTYAGEVCEVGDLIYAKADKGTAYKAADFFAVQRNLDMVAITNAEIDTIVAS